MWDIISHRDTGRGRNVSWLSGAVSTHRKDPTPVATCKGSCSMDSGEQDNAGSDPVNRNRSYLSVDERELGNVVRSTGTVSRTIYGVAKTFGYRVAIGLALGIVCTSLIFAIIQSAAINRLEEVNGTQYEMLEEMKTLLDRENVQPIRTTQEN